MNLNQLWKMVLAELELSVSRATYKTHFANTRLLSLEKGVASVGVPNPMLRVMIESRYYSLIKSVLDAHTQQNVSLVFVVNAPAVSDIKKQKPTPLFDNLPVGSSLENIQETARRLRIRPDYTFDNFAVSTTNQMAHAAASAVSKSPGKAYNPLFLYGGVGVGKTHLMHAIANSLLKDNQRFRIVCCMGEEFLNEIIEAIQTKTAQRFKQKYRSAQLLLVDDVQFIAGKNTAQEEFFHTFNAVYREGGQIILTSDRHPSEISKLEERLRSRFEGGLIVDVARPDFELRAAIVNIKSNTMGLSVPSDAAQLVAANITDTRAIEGFLQKLSTYLLSKPVPVTPDLIASLMGKPKTGQESLSKRRVSAQDVLEVVARYYDLKTSVLKGIKRARPIVRPRQVVMYLCKTELGITLNDIGGVLGGRDHTTIIHGIEKITKELVINEDLRTSLLDIKHKLLLS